MNTQNIKTLVLDWIDAWNKRDIDRIMTHYVDDVIIYSPAVVERWNLANGKMQGKARLKEHFLKGFELTPASHFKYLDILYGIDGVIILYTRETGSLAADIITLNNEMYTSQSIL